MKNFSDFIRACYLASEPSIDLNEVSEDNPIDCCKHRLSQEKYCELQKELAATLVGKATSDDVMFATNMWCLQSGPQIV